MCTLRVTSLIENKCMELCIYFWQVLAGATLRAVLLPVWQPGRKSCIYECTQCFPYPCHHSSACMCIASSMHLLSCHACCISTSYPLYQASVSQEQGTEQVPLARISRVSRWLASRPLAGINSTAAAPHVTCVAFQTRFFCSTIHNEHGHCKQRGQPVMIQS